MPYSSQSKRNTPAIVAVALVHVAIGYAFVSGLAYQVFERLPFVTTARLIDEPPPPPLVRQQLPQAKLPPRAEPELTQIVPLVSTPALSDPPLTTILVDQMPQPEPLLLRQQVDPTPPPTKPAQTRAAEPAAGRSSWVTTDDYPARALREGAAGSVGISVQIGLDGRVSACQVTASSGNAELDEATCRFYARRARFRPALDAAGNTVAARYADRVRWQLPQ